MAYFLMSPDDRVTRNIARYVDRIRNTVNKDTGINEAAVLALRQMPDDFLIKPLLKTHEAEVNSMFIIGDTEEEINERFKEEGRAEGRAEERANTERERKRADEAEARFVRSICMKMRKGKTSDQIAEDLEVDIDQINPICDAALEFAPDYDPEKVVEKIITKK